MTTETPHSSRRILVIEDDPDIAHLVELHLRDLGCEVEAAADGGEGLEKALSSAWDLVILDLMLPGVDGLEICRRLRSQPSYVPVLMLTAKSSDLDRVLGLELGADDYLTKPFNILELVARVKAMFRRIEALKERREPETERLSVAGLQIDVARRQVIVRDRPVELTAREFDLLLHFARHPGRVYSRFQLLDLVWGYGHSGYEHTVNSHINRLRGKIEQDPSRPRYILTVWGVGYKFSDEQRSTEE
jgi:DNA-binding response OmpR family regulator